jgi:superfamily I DNA and RNA helicase
MSLWWAKKDQLDDEQLDLIENLEHAQNHLIYGPPGSGKTNILLRRAQFVRSQGFTNVRVLTFTRPLTEFVRTGCLNSQGKEIFPSSLIGTVERFSRDLFDRMQVDPPDDPDFRERKRIVAKAALALVPQDTAPKHDVLFVDEAQDLMPEEVAFLGSRAKNLFFVADSRQKIYEHSGGLEAVEGLVPPENRHTLKWHYRIAPEICTVADKILTSTSGSSLLSTQLYKGPKPGKVDDHGPLIPDEQMAHATERLADQIRVYAGLIAQGDRLGVVVPRTRQRDDVFEFLEADSRLRGRSQIVRARTGDEDDDHDPTLDPERPILIVTTKGVKGLEFRALHWLFCDDLAHYQTRELYYTVVTRAKTRVDLYYSTELPPELAQAHAKPDEGMWE